MLWVETREERGTGQISGFPLFGKSAPKATKKKPCEQVQDPYPHKPP
jgi:hypothetical protein